MGNRSAEPAIYRLEQLRVSRAFRKAAIARFRARMAGGHRIPRDTGALLVCNHGSFGLEAWPLSMLCVEQGCRMPRFLGERNLWRVPGLGRFLEALGAVRGEQDPAVELLKQGWLVGVYPGGVDDAFKLESQAYRLQWGKRAGFARVAMRAAVPIIPIVGEGVDELLPVVKKETWLGRRLLGSQRYDLPIATAGAWGLPIPRRAPLVFHVLEPVDTTGNPDDEHDVERVRRATYERMESVLRVLRALHERRQGRGQRHVGARR